MGKRKQQSSLGKSSGGKGKATKEKGEAFWPWWKLNTPWTGAAVGLLAIVVFDWIKTSSHHHHQSFPHHDGTATTNWTDMLSEEDLMKLWGVHPEKGQVDRIPLSEMTHEKFLNEYLIPRRPFVIEGAYATSPLSDSNGDWSFQNIRQKFGHLQLPYKIPPQVGDNYNCSLAGLCIKNDLTLGQMMDETVLLPIAERQKRLKANIPQPYPHDMNLQKYLPEIYHVYQKLSYFTENLKTSSNPGGLEHWPSLFFGPIGTTSGLHVDDKGLSFTMAVFQGRKQFGKLH